MGLYKSFKKCFYKKQTENKEIYPYGANEGSVKTRPKPVIHNIPRNNSFNDIDNFLSGKPFVNGCFGSLYINKNDDTVIKKFNFFKDYYHEKEVYQTLESNLLIKSICAYISFNDNLKCITMKNYNNDLLKYTNENGIMERTQCMKMCFNINMGLFYINSKGYIYGDLKLENVCLKNNDINFPVIIDLGSCSKTKPTISLDTASPEALCNKALNYKHDIWTLGILYMECITTCCSNPNKVYKNIYPWYKGSMEEMQMLHDDIFFRNCTHINPNERHCIFTYLQ